MFACGCTYRSSSLCQALVSTKVPLRNTPHISWRKTKELAELSRADHSPQRTPAEDSRPQQSQGRAFTEHQHRDAPASSPAAERNLMCGTRVLFVVSLPNLQGREVHTGIFTVWQNSLSPGAFLSGAAAPWGQFPSDGGSQLPFGAWHWDCWRGWGGCPPC